MSLFLSYGYLFFLFIIYFDIYIYQNNFKTFSNKKYPFIAYTLIIFYQIFINCILYFLHFSLTFLNDIYLYKKRKKHNINTKDVAT